MMAQKKRNHKYTSEELAFLAQGYQTMNARNLTAAFNERFSLELSRSAVQRALTRNKIRCGRKGKSLLIENPRRLFTKEQETFIRQGFKDYTMSDLTVLFNERFGTDRTAAQLRSFAANQKIRSGRRPNLKKNFKPPNCKPLGAERIYERDNLILIKVAETDPFTGRPFRYKHKHIHVYEKHYGPVPEGKVVTFLDGDTLNCDPANLTAVTRGELMAMNLNHYRRMPDELKPTVFALSKLQAKACTLAKEAG